MEVVTDGEMRRLSFQSQMVEAVDGFGDWDLDAFLWGSWRSDVVGDLEPDRPRLRCQARRSSADGSCPSTSSSTRSPELTGRRR